MTEVYLNMRQAADYLGIELTYFRRQIYLGNAPIHMKPSPRVSLFTKTDLDNWKTSWTMVKAK